MERTGSCIAAKNGKQTLVELAEWLLRLQSGSPDSQARARLARGGFALRFLFIILRTYVCYFAASFGQCFVMIESNRTHSICPITRTVHWPSAARVSFSAVDPLLTKLSFRIHSSGEDHVQSPELLTSIRSPPRTLGLRYVHPCFSTPLHSLIPHRDRTTARICTIGLHVFYL